MQSERQRVAAQARAEGAEASAKIRSGPPLPDDNAEDRALPYWSGVIPVITTRGERIPA